MLSTSVKKSFKPRCFNRLLSTIESNGLKISSIENNKPVSQLSLVVRGGSRYEPTSSSGVSHYLEKFSFKNTKARSGLRLIRESELLGGQLTSSVDRENLVLTAKFLREDLPYFVNALGDVVDNTIYNKYELDEEIRPAVKLEYELANERSSSYTATEAVHQVAFHNGLGNSILAHPYANISIENIKNFAREVYTKSNIEIVASDVNENDLSTIIGTSKLASLSSGSKVESTATTTHSGEVRIRTPSNYVNSVVIGFPTVGNSATNEIIAQYLGTKVHNIKWSLGGSTPLGIASRKTNTNIYASNTTYSDASLLTLTIEGSDAASTKAGAIEAVNALKSLSATELSTEQFARAQAKAKFAAAETSENILTKLTSISTNTSSVTSASLKEAASTLTSGKVALAVVGQITELPYLDELF